MIWLWPSRGTEILIKISTVTTAATPVTQRPPHRLDSSLLLNSADGAQSDESKFVWLQEKHEDFKWSFNSNLTLNKYIVQFVSTVVYKYLMIVNSNSINRFFFGHLEANFIDISSRLWHSLCISGHLINLSPVFTIVLVSTNEVRNGKTRGKYPVKCTTS